MKRNLRKAFAFILALTMVVSLFACGKKDANPDGGDSSSDDTFTIAYIGPLTGEASAWGTPEANTLKLLVDQVNAEGGIAGKKVILNTYDNRGDNVETTNAAKKAIEVGGADVIVGCNTVPGETPEKIIVDLQSAVQREKLHASFEFAVEKPFYPSFLLNDNLEEICRLRHIFEEVTGEELKLVCSDGVSDNNHWSTIGGIPSVCFGPGGKGLHQSDEWVSTEQMENVLEVYLRFFLEDEE